MRKITKKLLQTEMLKDNFKGTEEEFKVILKKRLEKEAEQESIEGLRLRDIQDTKATIKTIGDAPNERKVFILNEEVVVSHGGFQYAEIREVIAEGVYDVYIEYETSRPYSKEKYHTNRTMILGWWQIFKKEDLSEDFSGEELHIQFMQQTVESLLGKYFYNRGVDMNPDYQRGLVWTDEQKEALLDSIFNYIDIGKFVFVRLPYSPDSYNYEILDGKQKLNTLIEFYTDQFKYKGFYYSQLNWHMKYIFKNKSVAVGEVSDRTYDKQNILKYFVALNTSGQPMDKEHLNKVKLQIVE